MVQVEVIQAEELTAALNWLLAPPGAGRTADPAHVASFQDYLAACASGWHGIRSRRDGRETALALTLILPGRTAIVMFPSLPGDPETLDDQRRLLSAAVDHAAPLGLHYLQVLVEPGDARKDRLLEQVGFRPLTRLIYLRRSAKRPRYTPPVSADVRWVAFNETRRDLFAGLIKSTYVDTLDCPELSELRPMNDVLLSHQASGQFVPELWEIAEVDGQDAAVLLLAPLFAGSCLDIVYMGVADGFRRKGLGGLLLQRALERCRAYGANDLTAVVDARNAPARRLYERAGFKAVTSRDAHLYLW